MTDAELGQQRIDSADLNARSPASVAQLCRINVVVPVGNEQRQRREPIEDARARSRSRKSLQQLLQDEAGSEKLFPGRKRAHELKGFGCRSRRIASQGQRPHARINKQAQWRERSTL